MRDKYSGADHVAAKALFLSILILYGSAAAQNMVWSASYGGTYNEGGYACLSLPDSGYVAVGSTFSFGSGDYDVYLLRLDSLGNILWSRTYGGPASDMGHDIQTTPDGGFIIVGTTSSYGAGGADLCLWRTDSAGQLQWTRTFGGAQTDEGWSIRATYDRGFVVCGSTSSSGAGYADLFVIKVDSLGNSDWAQTFGGSGGESGYAIRQTRDSGYVAVGATGSFGEGYSSIYAVRVSPMGDSLWAKTYGGARADVGYSVEVTPDGGFVLVGVTASYGLGYYDAYLVRTDADGTQLWDKTYGGARDDYGYSVSITPDGFLLAGTTESSGAGASDVFVVKADPVGTQVWSHTYGGNKADYCRTILKNRLSQFVAVGSTYSYGVGGSDLYMVALMADGQTPVDDWSGSLPEGFDLTQNYPNPFNATTRIEFSVGFRTNVRLTLYNILGQEVRTWLIPRATEGSSSIDWDGTDATGRPVATGVYLYRIEAGPFVQSRKMVLLK
ncbi:MAG: T9SS type A sorting domain-containing protein [Candidatus Zixiibacteriota bacterium]